MDLRNFYMTNKPKTLRELRRRISEEVPHVGIKPYSHNIISLLLMQIQSVYGTETANKAIEDFCLEALGWRQIDEKH